MSLLRFVFFFFHNKGKNNATITANTVAIELIADQAIQESDMNVSGLIGIKDSY